jgi:hypothetical protein
VYSSVVCSLFVLFCPCFGYYWYVEFQLSHCLCGFSTSLRLLSSSSCMLNILASSVAIRSATGASASATSGFFFPASSCYFLKFAA